MIQYEKILSKISPIFYKFISYSDYFMENRADLLNFINNYDFDVEHYYSFNEVNYSLLVIRNLITNYRPYVWFVISLRKSNGFTVDLIYGFIQFVTTMVINNFNFENQEIVASRRPCIFLPSKDLFIRLVGKDTYDTIRKNIK